MIRFATAADAKQVVKFWDGNEDSIQHLGDRGNSVFLFANANEKPQILRFTDPDFRSPLELHAEINFISHCYRSGASVAPVVPATDGSFVKNVQCASGELLCSSIAFAPGLEVQEGSPLWTGLFLENGGEIWGSFT